MLKRIINDKLMDSNGSQYEYHCTWQWVTNSYKVYQCETTTQKLIDAANKKIEEYENLKEDIENKKKTAQDLEGTFDKCQDAIINAHLNCEDLNNCEDCITNLMQTFDTMAEECKTKIDEWTTTRDDLITKKAECATSQANKDYKCV